MELFFRKCKNAAWKGGFLEATLQKSRAFAFGENASSAVLNFITLRVL
jgi:hypothetical protein